MEPRAETRAWVALLRGINVGGRNRVRMAELRAVCEGLGWSDVRTHIQSGNVVFRAGGAPGDLESALERALAHQLGLKVPVILRDEPEWVRYVEGNPFPQETEEDPGRVILGVSKGVPADGAAESLQERGTMGERVVAGPGALWMHFPGGMGRSKLTPALIDRIVGSPLTARNWRTVLELSDLLRSARL